MDGAPGFFRGRTRYAHFFLYGVDSLRNVREAANVVVNAGDFFGIFQQPLHFFTRAAISQFEIVQHRKVALREALVRVLYAFNGRAHFVGVVRHINYGLVAIVSRGRGIPAQGLQQGRRKRRNLLHVFIGG